nr:MAG TPA: crossover junction endodeoxyribonuclease [Caudoviricetes sp.]
MTQTMKNDFQWGQKYVKLHLADTIVEAREIIVPLPPSKNKLHEVNYVGVKEVFSHQYVNSKKTKRGVIKTSTEYNRWKSSTARELKRGKKPPINEPCNVLITVVLPNAKSDPHNYEEAFFDALQVDQCVYTNDKLVKFHVLKGEIIPDCVPFILAYVFECSKYSFDSLCVKKERIKNIAEIIKNVCVL